MLHPLVGNVGPRSLAILRTILVVLVLVTANLPLSVAAFRANCGLFVDGSGSGADDPVVREWLLSMTESLTDVYASVAPDRSLTLGIFDEEVRILGTTATGPSDGIDDVRGTIDSGLWARRWTNPLAVLAAPPAVVDVDCLILITDGSVDPPPDLVLDPAAYTAKALAAADSLGDQGVRVVIVALSGERADLWHGVAERTDGVYVVNPDATTLHEAVAALIAADEPPLSATPASATPVPTPGWTPGPTPTTGATPTPSTAPSSSSTPLPDGPSSSGISFPVWLVALPTTMLGIVVTTVVHQRARRHRLAGQLVVMSENVDAVVDLSDYRGSVTIGSDGRVRLEGPGVRARHARLLAARDEDGLLSTVVRPLDGRVFVRRGDELIRVILDLPLADGDVLILGDTSLEFRILVKPSV